MAAAESKCSNCEGDTICVDVMTIHATQVAGGEANAQCTRTPVLRIHRVSQCPLRHVLIGEEPIAAVCAHPKTGSSCAVFHASPLPDGCPLLERDGAGLTLKAAVKG